MTVLFAGLLSALTLLFAAPAGAVCVGDCRGDGAVTVDEIVIGVNIGLGATTLGQCPAMDGSVDGAVTVDEIITAVTNALNGCPEESFAGAYSGSVEFGAAHTGAIALIADDTGAVAGSVSISANLLPRGTSPVPFPSTAFVEVSGSYNPATGTFDVSGSFLDQTGVRQPLSVRGTLPSPNSSAAISVQVADQVYEATLTNEGTPPLPTPTATSAAVPTATPADRPPSPDGCSGGYVRATFSEAAGTNSYTDLGGSADLFKVDGSITAVAPTVTTFGSNAVTCPTRIDAIIQTFRVGIAGNINVAAGQSFPLSNKTNIGDPSKPTIAFVDYLEIVPTNPFGTRGWRADTGTLTIDSIAGDTVRARVDAHMIPEPSFSAQTPAMGAFRLQASIIIDSIVRQ